MRVLILLILLSGCYTPKRIAKICKTCPTSRTDSTWYKSYVSFRDSVIALPKDSASIEYIVTPCPDGTIPSVVQVGKTESNNTKINGVQTGRKLKVKSINTPDTIYIKVPTYIEKSGSKSNQTICPDELWGHHYFYYCGWLMHLLTFMALLCALIYYRNSTSNSKNTTV